MRGHGHWHWRCTTVHTLGGREKSEKSQGWFTWLYSRLVGLGFSTLGLLDLVMLNSGERRLDCLESRHQKNKQGKSKMNGEKGENRVPLFICGARAGHSLFESCCYCWQLQKWSLEYMQWPQKFNLGSKDISSGSLLKGAGNRSIFYSVYRNKCTKERMNEWCTHTHTYIKWFPCFPCMLRPNWVFVKWIESWRTQQHTESHLARNKT